MTKLSRRRFSGLVAAGLAAPVLARAEAGRAQEESASTQVFVFSNSSPHISVVDPESRDVVDTVEIDGFTSWTWNDDNNSFDGTHLWLGMRDPDSEEVEVVTLDLDSLEITNRIPIGTDSMSLYIGKPAGDGSLHVGKMGAGEVVHIDTESFEVFDTWSVPVNGDVVCDADIVVAEDGSELFVYPTRNGDTVVTIDAATGETVTEIETPSGARPLMLTTDLIGRVWVQEAASNTNAVFDAQLNLLSRFPAGGNPIVNTFSPDGAFSYVGHGDDTFVQVVDTEALEEVARVQVGTNPSKLGVNPNGEEIYAIITDEAALAIIDTASWEVSDRVELGTNPNGIFVRPAWYEST